jgi:hypothetical protein
MPTYADSGGWYRPLSIPAKPQSSLLILGVLFGTLPAAANRPEPREAIRAPDETIFGRRRSQPETSCLAEWRSLIKQRGAIMWAIISSIYRAYCYARLLEMRSTHRHASHA